MLAKGSAPACNIQAKTWRLSTVYSKMERNQFQHTVCPVQGQPGSYILEAGLEAKGIYKNIWLRRSEPPKML